MPRSNHGWTGNDRFVYAALTVPNLMVMCMAFANRHWPAAYLTFGLACIYVCCLLSTLGWLKPERWRQWEEHVSMKLFCMDTGRLLGALVLLQRALAMTANQITSAGRPHRRPTI